MRITIPGVPGVSQIAGVIDNIADAVPWVGDAHADVPRSGTITMRPSGEHKPVRRPSRPKKPKKPKRPKRSGKPKPTDVVPVAATMGVPADPGPAVDYAALAKSVGLDPALFKGLNPRVGNLIPLAMGNRGAQVMSRAEQDALVQSLIGNQYTTQLSLLDRERARTEAQNKMNLANIKSWYDQVMQSQGVAAQRDQEFGQAAVQSATDSTAAIVSALGGADNPGSYVAGAAGNENVGNLNAIAAIQNQHNADMAPLLQAEGAGQLTREQGLGAARTRDLAMKIAEMQAQRGSAEADLRFKLWQSNNEVLNQRLQNQLAIRQANTGLRQQWFNNNVGIRQMIAAAQAGAAGNLTDVAAIAQRDADSRQDNAIAASKEAFRQQMEIAKESGRNYRAKLSAKGRKTQATYATASNDTRDSAWNDIVDVLDGQDLTPQQAMKVAVAVVGGYGWSPRNAAVQALITTALKEAGY